MIFDPLSEKLRQTTNVAMPGLLERIEKYEHMTLMELQEAFDACEERFRAWVRDPANEGKEIKEAPEYLDRIALDSLRERRTWWE